MFQKSPRIIIISVAFCLMLALFSNPVRAVPAACLAAEDCDFDVDGLTEEQGDCNDNDVNINFDATDVCDGVDNNCDGSIDEGFDSDADGTADCFDTEVCDALDNDGDGEIDEGVETTYYEDADADTYGNATEVISGCAPPDGFVANDDDCDDTDININPSAGDIGGDGIDQDCSGADASLEPLTSEDLCTDSVDNDEDGLIDCDDTDCEADAACPTTLATSTEVICTDAIDNDDDDLIDCDDTDCAAEETCASTTTTTSAAASGSSGCALALGPVSSQPGILADGIFLVFTAGILSVVRRKFGKGYFLNSQSPQL